LVFTITADRFLRNMVRAIVGTLLEVGRGRLDENDFRRIIEAKDRRSAGTICPRIWAISSRYSLPRMGVSNRGLIAI